MESAKILVIDDEESLRFTFKHFLEKEGHQVTAVPNYDTAMNSLLKNSFDLVFADVLLGKHTGIDVLREVGKRGYFVPVIMITGQPSIDSAAEAVRLGAFDYLPKPVRKETLLRVTASALRHKKLHEEKQRIEEEKDRLFGHLKAVFNSVQDAIVSVDTDMRVIECNSAAETFFARARTEIIGKGLDDVCTGCCNGCVDVIRSTLKRGEAILEQQVNCEASTGSQRVVVLTCTPLVDSAGTPLAAVLAIRDITRLYDLERELHDRRHYRRIVGKSVKMQEIYNMVDNLRETETTVLITGPSGTGKELIAEALHEDSPRTSKALIKVNCSALSENLLESELFGHVKGAFTGAVRDKAGRFELADGGSIFLDEIGDISPLIQLKLLRVLQEKEFERVGDAKPLRADVRVIAATNRNLRELVRRGLFREDLFYRLKVVEIALPPLREHNEDIPLLIDHFCKRFNNSFSKRITGVDDNVLSFFMNYHWPGNVRELEHAIEHAFVLCPGGVVTQEHLPADITGGEAEAGQEEQPMTISSDAVKEALRTAGGNKAKAARLLGISRQTIYRKIKELGITE